MSRVIITILSLVILSIPGFANTQKSTNPFKKTVWATYISWGPLVARQASLCRPDATSLNASADNIKSFRTEIDVARKYGINGFLFDLIYPKKGKRSTFYRCFIMDGLLEAAKGTDFYINPTLDGVNIKNAEDPVESLVNFNNKYINNPNVMKIDGKIAMFSYHLNTCKPEFWKKLLADCKKRGVEFYMIFDFRCPADQFHPDQIEPYAQMPEIDAIYSFFQPIDPAKHLHANMLATQKYNKLFGGSLFPGYIGDMKSWRSDWYWPFFGVGAFFKSAEAVEKYNPDFIHLTSWNDYQETEFRPTIFQQDCDLRLIKYFVDRWRGEKAVYPGKIPDLIFAFRREILAGEILRIESVNLPSVSQSENITIQVKLARNDTGKEIYKSKQHQIDLSKLQRYAWRIPSWTFNNQDYPPAVYPIVVVNDGTKIKEFSLPSILIRHGRLSNMVTQMVALRNVPTTENVKCDVSLPDKQTAKLKINFKGDEKLKSCQVMYGGRIIYSIRKDDFEGKYSVGLSGNLKVRGYANATLKVTVKNGRIEKVVRRFTHNSPKMPEWKLENSDKQLLVPRIGFDKLNFDIIGNDQTEVQVDLGNCNGHTTLESLKKAGNILTVVDSKDKKVYSILNDGEDAFPARRPQIEMKQGSIDVTVPLPEPAGTNSYISLYMVYDNDKSNVLGPYWLRPSTSKMTVPLFCSNEEFDEKFLHVCVSKANPRSYISQVKVPFHALQYDIYDFTTPEGEAIPSYGSVYIEAPNRVPSFGSSYWEGALGGVAWRSSAPKCCPQKREENGTSFFHFDGKDDYIILGVRNLFSGASSVAIRFRPLEINKKQVLFCNGRSRKGYYETMMLYIDKDGKLKVEREDPVGLLPSYDKRRTFWVHSKFKTVTVSTKSPLQKNKWYDVKAIYDYKTLSLYLDGKKVGEAKCGPVFTRGNNFVRVGNHIPSGTEFNSRVPGSFSFNGDIQYIKYCGWPVSGDIDTALKAGKE